jgi:hypothetical protein
MARGLASRARTRAFSFRVRSRMVLPPVRLPACERSSPHTMSRSNCCAPPRQCGRLAGPAARFSPFVQGLSLPLAGKCRHPVKVGRGRCLPQRRRGPTRLGSPPHTSRVGRCGEVTGSGMPSTPSPGYNALLPHSSVGPLGPFSSVCCECLFQFACPRAPPALVLLQFQEEVAIWAEDSYLWNTKLPRALSHAVSRVSRALP